jgi:DNA-binding CsgD family transcriptional regulator
MIPLTVGAIRGDGEDSAEQARQIASWAAPRALDGLVSWCHHIQGAAALGRGDYEEAFQHATAVSKPGTIPSDPIALRSALDLVESAMRTERVSDAVTHAAALRAAGVHLVSDRLALLTAGVSAVVAQPDELDQFRRVLAMPATARYPFETARIRLIYGERLRRVRLTVHAREQLAGALATFRTLGARPWAERAARELEAASAARHRGGRHDVHHLTSQEREVADLAATGLSNRQIADRLQISPLTVAAHLRKVYRKLAITSRSALRTALTPSAESSLAS